VHQSCGAAQVPSTAALVEMITGSVAAGTAATSSRAAPAKSLWAATPFLERRQPPASADDPRLRVEDLHGAEIDGLDLDVRGGEIVGFVGLRHEGMAELPRILSGTIQRRSGSVLVDGEPLPRRMTPTALIRAGLYVVPADRLHEGGIASLSAQDNLTMPAEGTYWHRRSRVRALAGACLEALDVQPPLPGLAFGQFSGGNQQKIIVCKWLSMRPAVLVLDDPTQGVDPAARERLFDAITNAAALGTAVLFFSTEPELMTRICTRVIHLRAGRAAEVMSGEAMSVKEVLTRSYA
jgi:ribose transport system ATP-binding protein